MSTWPLAVDGTNRNPITVLADGISFAVRLTPKGRRDEVEGWSKDANGSPYLKARVSAVPENGKANDALLRLLSKVLGVPKSRISIVAGETARLKRIAVSGDAAALRLRLTSLGDVG